MLANLVWLFPAYRRLYEENVILTTALTEANRIISEGKAFNLDDALATYNERILQEAPFPDGKIPDHVWLTPGERD